MLLVLAKDADDSKCSVGTTTGNFCGNLFLFCKPNRTRSPNDDHNAGPDADADADAACFSHFLHFSGCFSHSLMHSHSHTVRCATKLQFPLRLMKKRFQNHASASLRWWLTCFACFPPAKSCHQLNFKRLFLHVRKSRRKYLPRQPCVVSISVSTISRFPHFSRCVLRFKMPYTICLAYHPRVLTIRFDYAFKSNCCRRGSHQRQNANMKRLQTQLTTALRSTLGK